MEKIYIYISEQYIYIYVYIDLSEYSDRYLGRPWQILAKLGQNNLQDGYNSPWRSPSPVSSFPTYAGFAIVSQTLAGCLFPRRLFLAKESVAPPKEPKETPQGRRVHPSQQRCLFMRVGKQTTLGSSSTRRSAAAPLALAEPSCFLYRHHRWGRTQCMRILTVDQKTSQ